MRFQPTATLVACVFALVSFSASAVDYKTEYDKKIKASQDVGVLGEGLAGDQVNFYTGATTLTAVDTSVPGNSGLAVALGRSYTFEQRHMHSDTGNGAQASLPNAETWGTVQRAFGDWDLDVPHISTTMDAAQGWVVNTATPFNRCSVAAPATGKPPAAPASGGELIGAGEYWHGYDLHLPGSSQSILLANEPNNEKPTTGGPYYWTTNKDWWFSCISSIANASSDPSPGNHQKGQGFLAIAPDGTKYTFDWMTHRAVSDWTRVDELDGSQYKTRYVFRDEYLMLPTAITDRFGNWVHYTWSDANGFARLVSITSSDGRTITPHYNAKGFIDSVTDGTRTWTYTYAYYTDYNYEIASLSQVTQPDGTSWQYSLGAMRDVYTGPSLCQRSGAPGEDPWNCFGDEVVTTPFNPSDNGSSVYVIHPSGARIDFALGIYFHMGGNGSYPLGLMQKKISGPGLTDAVWQYALGYTPTTWHYACLEAAGCPHYLYTDEKYPDGSVTRRVFGMTLGVDESMQLAEFRGTLNGSLPTGGTAAITSDARYGRELAGVTQMSGDTLAFYSVSTTDFAAPTQNNGFTVKVGTNPLSETVGSSAGTFASERRLPTKTHTTIQQGATLINNTTAYNVYAQPTSVTRSSSGLAGPATGYSRTETLGYSHDTAKWVIGQPTTVTDVGTGAVVSQTDYDASSQLPIRTYNFGLLQQTMTYNGDGTLATIKDGNNNSISLSNWYRGVPRSIAFPTAASMSATVNPIGTIASSTDELGSTSNYDYDAMGRLNNLAYPTGDTTNWNPLTRNIVPVNSSEYGVPAGHWKQTASTGNGRTTTVYDARWNPVLVLTEDTANASSKSYVVKRYDGLGRPVFSSYPVASVSAVTDTTLKGVVTDYDVLGRVVTVKQDSELGVLNTSTEYLSGFQTRVTNPRGYKTTTSYQIFDAPSTDAPVSIIKGVGLPEQQTTTITRDIFGAPLTITRTGAGG